METEMGARNVEFRDMFFAWDGDCCSICRVKHLGRNGEKWGGLVILRGKPRHSSQTWTQLLPVLWGSWPRQLRAHGTETRNIELFSTRPLLVDTFAHLVSHLEADTAKIPSDISRLAFKEVWHKDLVLPEAASMSAP